ncbi:MAG: hypothetical protein ACHP7N_17665 [Caulobacterales bacterium]
MAEISIGSALGSGFNLIGRRPFSVLVWGLVRMALVVAAVAMLAPFYIDMFATFARSAQAGASGPPDFSAMMPRMMAMQGLAQLVNILQLLVGAVIYCAVFRAVLHPDRSAFAYLRVSAPELFLVVLIFAGSIALVFAILLVALPIGIVIGIVAATSHGSGVGFAIFLPILILVLLIAILIVALRFSFVGPMMVDDGKFHLFESWNLTKGHTGSLFVIALGLFGIALVAELVLGVILFGLGAAMLGAAAGGFDHLPAFFSQPPMVIFQALAPGLIVYAVLAVPLTGCAVAIFAAPWAHAYRDLAAGDKSETFA